MRNSLAALILVFPFAAAAEPVKIVAMGDSLTQGYGLPPEQGFVPQLQAWLAANGSGAVVVNAGVSGDTTAGGRERADWALEPGAGALILELGANDMLRGLDPGEAKANLSAILAKAKERGLPVLLIGIEAPGNYGEGYKAAFDGLWPELSMAYGTLLVADFLAPVREAMRAGTPMDKLVQEDGLHPTATGVGLIVGMVGPRVLELAAKAGER
ncbi:MAG: arylesterase [Paracoccaceae bacterium]